jgi:hypothetical protein
VRIALGVAGTQAHLAQQLPHPLDLVRPAADQLPEADRLGDDVAHPPARVERGVGILEDHLHPGLLLRMQRAGPSAAEIDAFEIDLAARGLVETDHQPRHRRLAAARFAHQAEGLAF